MAITRFAPSPTGLLHLGHAYSASFAYRNAGECGTMLLRIEDIDMARCRDDFIAEIETDLHWLGLTWPTLVRRQSAHMQDYEAALARLDRLGILYPCFCTRTDLAHFGAAPHGKTPLYPGTCRRLSTAERQNRIAQHNAYALRLDVARAIALTGPLRWRDLDRGWIDAEPALLGDVVLGRKDISTSYHIAVTWCDAAQSIEIVTRADDLFEATHVHRLLQALLDLPVPVWRHHRLITDESGRRLAKRTHAPTLKAMREAGQLPKDILRLFVL